MALPTKMKQCVEIQQVYNSDSILHVSDPQEWVAYLTRNTAKGFKPGEDRLKQKFECGKPNHIPIIWGCFVAPIRMLIWTRNNISLFTYIHPKTRVDMTGLNQRRKTGQHIF